ncbi:MAG: TRAP transporter permease [Hyphomicrobiales bacterium]|nr:TRAP transporter permease [Hyphomicrobiales bacterium]
MAAAETGARNPSGWVGRLLFWVAIAWSLFQLWIASPFPFTFNFLILGDTQARPIHLAFALFLAYLAFPGLLHLSRAIPVYTLAWGIGGIGLLLYSVTLILDGNEQWIIFVVMGVLSLLIAQMARRPMRLNRIPGIDWILAVVAAASAAYLVIFFRDLAARPGAPTLFDLVTAGAGLVLLLEAARRTLGPALTIIALIFLIYTFGGPYVPDIISHRGASFQRAMSQQWLSSEGVFGIALGVSTSFVFLFVLFGSLLARAGAGNYFIKVSFALLGHLRGGPAKAAVVSSGLTGLVSGSSIANVVTTGTFTIPLMKRVGYTPEKAGSFEVAASVNGQIMPPIMGAAAFLIAEYVGIAYTEVIRAAFVPAIATYISLFYIVHIEAMKANISGLPRARIRPVTARLLRAAAGITGVVILANAVYYTVGWTKEAFGSIATFVLAIALAIVYVLLIAWRSRYPDLEPDDPNDTNITLPDAIEVARTGFHFLLPLIVLVWCLMVEHLSPGLSAFWATIPLIVIILTQDVLTGIFRGDHGVGRHFARGVWNLGAGLRNGAMNMIGVAIATATAGIIVGTVALTGVGLVMTEVVELLSGGNLILMLILTAVLCLVLGMGLPTTANYIVVATLMAPVIVQLSSSIGLAVPLIAAHLFVFYFGLMADVTPPVGLASFAASAISGASPIATGLQAFRYEIRTGILPFIFVFNNQLLLIGVTNVFHGAAVIIAAIIAMLVFVAVTQNWFVTRSRIWETAILLLACFTLLRPGFWMDMIEPSHSSLPPAELRRVVEAAPADTRIRLAFEGLDLGGNQVSKVVVLDLGSEGPAEKRLRAAGLGVAFLGEDVQVTDVTFGSEAARYGIDFGMDISMVLVENPDRLPKELLFLPALALIGLIFVIQRRRATAEPSVPPATT